MLLQHIELMVEVFIASRNVPAVGIFRDDFKHHLLAAAAYRDRRMGRLDRLGRVESLAKLVVTSLEIRALLAKQELHDLQALIELAQARAGRGELIAVA